MTRLVSGFFASAVLLGALLPACVVHEDVRPENRPPSRCAGGEWVPRHQGPHGAWHEGHWRCPGEREVVEVD